MAWTGRHKDETSSPLPFSCASFYKHSPTPSLCRASPPSRTPHILSSVSLHPPQCSEGPPVNPPPTPPPPPPQQSSTSFPPRLALRHTAAFTPACQRDLERSRQPCNETIKLPANPAPHPPATTRRCTHDQCAGLSLALLRHMCSIECSAHIC